MIQTLVSFVSSIFFNFYIILWAMRCDMFQYLLTLAQTVGIGRCLLCSNRGEKSQQGLIVYHGITSNQKKGGNLVQCRSSRQDLIIAKSTCEAELIASSEALQQGENIAIVVAEMTNKSCEIEVSSGNAASLHMVRNGSETAWHTRHISVKALLSTSNGPQRHQVTHQPQRWQLTA